MTAKLTTWTGALHQTFRLLPKQSGHLRPFLEADGMTPEELIKRLPFDRARSTNPHRETPNPKRYRDYKQVYQTVGLLYEGSDGKIHVSELGFATRRWLDILTPKNSIILARHAAYALSACQLKNPTGAGRRFDDSMEVFPFVFIWRAMLSLDGKISSDELNRALLKVRNERELQDAIDRIARAREANNIVALGEEVLTVRAKNDRIIPWLALASFGWVLFPDKRGGEGGGYYELIPETRDILMQASRMKRKHREFGSTAEYVEHVSRCAALPKDLR